MAEPNFIDALIAGAGAVVAYFVKTTRDDNKEQDRKLEALQREQAAMITRTEFRQEMRDLRADMNNNFALVFAKLDKKADKS